MLALHLCTVSVSFFCCIIWLPNSDAKKSKLLTPRTVGFRPRLVDLFQASAESRSVPRVSFLYQGLQVTSTSRKPHTLLRSEAVRSTHSCRFLQLWDVVVRQEGWLAKYNWVQRNRVAEQCIYQCTLPFLPGGCEYVCNPHLTRKLRGEEVEGSKSLRVLMQRNYLPLWPALTWGSLHEDKVFSSSSMTFITHCMCMIYVSYMCDVFGHVKYQDQRRDAMDLIQLLSTLFPWDEVPHWT